MDNKQVIETLNDLIENCKDGEFGFTSSAEHARTGSLKQTFLSRAQDCRLAAEELRNVVGQLGGRSTPDGGTLAGAAHRGWVAVKGTLAGYSDLNMLEEAERGEDKALERYRKALEEDLPADVRVVVQRQYEGAKRNHLQIRELRDAARRADNA
ncbi:MAG: PA2169 family four-helix-bundle protein [Comamonas sp.]|uniref:PA2169 family four-helix-bundle protein n=1 Tax=Comamonas sp. TaxID=34028 RepID=UPI002FCB4CEF